MTESPEPPVPSSLDMGCFPTMPLDVRRLLTSDTWLQLAASPAAAHAAVTLWSQCWHQIPAGSLPDSDVILWRLAMTDPATWKAIRNDALRGFIKCRDGRLYHPTVCQFAVELEERKKSETKQRDQKRENMRKFRDKQRSDNGNDHVAETCRPMGRDGSGIEGFEGKGVEEDAAANAAPRPNPDVLDATKVGSDPKSFVFKTCAEWLAPRCAPVRSVGSVKGALGSMVKDCGGGDQGIASVLAAVFACQRENPVGDAIDWMMGYFKRNHGNGQTKDRGADTASHLQTLARQAEEMRRPAGEFDG